MELITIELINEHTRSLLNELEAMKIIRVVHLPNEKIESHKNWVGSISKESAQKMLNELDKSREEWDRNI